MDDFEKLYKAAVRFLSFRPRSEKELRDYLAKKKCGSLTSERIIQSLTRDKFLNDQEFVRWWVEQRTLLKPKAWRVIKFELKQKGISDELIQNQESSIKYQDEDSALRLAEKKLKTIHDQSNKFKVKEKLGRYLASKGFDWDTVKEVVDQILAK
ncbi:MAG: regulatory protein RecX [Candidatus Levyibacteriota bacterium]|jgi:regulatory protein